MSQKKVTIKTRNINSKPLLDEIQTFIGDNILPPGVVDWTKNDNRLAVVAMLEELFNSLVDAKKIDRYKIVCDNRNNKSTNLSAGRVNLDISFQQKNCLNISKIDYCINQNIDYDFDDLKDLWYP